MPFYSGRDRPDDFDIFGRNAADAHIEAEFFDATNNPITVDGDLSVQVILHDSTAVEATYDMTASSPALELVSGYYRVQSINAAGFAVGSHRTVWYAKKDGNQITTYPLTIASDLVINRVTITAGLCVVYDHMYDPGGSAVVGVLVEVELELDSQYYVTYLGDVVSSTTTVTTYTDGVGYWQLSLIPSSLYVVHKEEDGSVVTGITPQYRFRLGTPVSEDALVTVPNQAQVDFSTL